MVFFITIKYIKAKKKPTIKITRGITGKPQDELLACFWEQKHKFTAFLGSSGYPFTTCFIFYNKDEKWDYVCG